MRTFKRFWDPPRVRGGDGTLFDFISDDRRVRSSYCVSHRERGSTCIFYALIKIGQCISTQVLQFLCLPLSVGASNFKIADIQTTEGFCFSVCSSHSVAGFCLVVFGGVFWVLQGFHFSICSCHSVAVFGLVVFAGVFWVLHGRGIILVYRNNIHRCEGGRQ